MEEEHADVLAGDAFPSRGRARDPAEARRVVHGPGADDEEFAVAHGRHGGPGGLGGGRDAGRGYLRGVVLCPFGCFLFIGQFL